MTRTNARVQATPTKVVHRGHEIEVRGSTMAKARRRTETVWREAFPGEIPGCATESEWRGYDPMRAP